MSEEYDDDREEEEEQREQFGETQASEQAQNSAPAQRVDNASELLRPGVNVYDQWEVAPKLIRLGFHPLGPYEGKNQNFFMMRNNETGERFTFGTPKNTSGEYRTEFVDELREEYANAYSSGGYQGEGDGSNYADEAIRGNRQNMREDSRQMRQEYKRELMDDSALWFMGKDSSRPMLKTMIEKSSWFHSAIWELGFNTFIVLTQAAPMSRANDPAELLASFQTKDGFKAYWRKHLGAMLDISRNAEALTQLQAALKIEEANRILTEERIGQLEVDLYKSRMTLQVATTCMCADDRMRYATARMINSFGDNPEGNGHREAPAVRHDYPQDPGAGMGQRGIPEGFYPPRQGYAGDPRYDPRARRTDNLKREYYE